MYFYIVRIISAKLRTAFVEIVLKILQTKQGMCTFFSAVNTIWISFRLSICNTLGISYKERSKYETTVVRSLKLYVGTFVISMTS